MARRKSGACPQRDAWTSGRNHHFQPGDVVEFGNSIGVILYPLKDMETYLVKIRSGIPNPWDCIEISMEGKKLIKVDKPNPTTYPTYKKYPGPSSEEIRRFEERKTLKRQKRSQKEAEEALQAYEEELRKKRSVKSEDSSDDDDIINDDEYQKDEKINENDEIYNMLKKDLDGEI
jgi:hypothetical protein